MSVKKITSLLGASGELKAIAARARRVNEWQRRYVRTVPAGLARSSRVAGVRNGVLIVHADNAAVAAKLKQMATRLAAAVTDGSEPVSEVRVLVQPEAQRTPQSKGGKGLPDSAVEHFSRLGATMPDTPLKAAVAALIAHHRHRTPRS